MISRLLRRPPSGPSFVVAVAIVALVAMAVVVRLPAPAAGAGAPTLVYLPFVSVPVPDLIQNGGFENGLSSWQTGATGGVSSPTVVTTIHNSGNASALLGNPNAGCLNAGPGDSYVAQTVSIPRGGSPTLTFYFDLMTFDHTQDNFAVFLNDYLSNPSAVPIYSFGTSTKPSQSGCDPTHFFDFGWQKGSVSLSQYQSQTITLYFVNQLTFDQNYNTWTYLDDVSIR